MVLKIASSSEIMEPLFGHQHLIHLSKETLGNGTLSSQYLGALISKGQLMTPEACGPTQPGRALTWICL